MPPKDRQVQLNFSVRADLPDETPSGQNKNKGKRVLLDLSPDSKVANTPIPISSDDSSVRSHSRSFDMDFNDANTWRRLQNWLAQMDKSERSGPRKANPGNCSRDARMETGSSRLRRRSLSSERCRNSDRLCAAQEELRVLKGLHDQDQVEITWLEAELQSMKERYEEAVAEIKNLQRVGRSADGIRAAALEEGYRRGLQTYRERIILLFPNIDRNRLPFYFTT